jgi:hypothetical protein
LPTTSFESDSAYESDSSNPRQRQRKGCLQLVKEMMDQFIVRGTHSPMQWMLDLRTYGLKIHYNSTARGHVEWVGQDEMLYKDLQFNMAQFRGMVHGLATESRRLLMDELLYNSSSAAELIPSVPWESLRDNLRYMTMAIEGSMSLSANHVASYPASRTKYPHPRVAIVMQFNHANCHLYLNYVSYFSSQGK